MTICPLYLQQNPESADVIVEKTGERQGKYLHPELYGMPESSAMFPKTEEQVKGEINPDRTKSNDTQNLRTKAANTRPVKLETGNANPLEK